MGGIKNIIPALLSIIVGFVLSFFLLNTYFNTTEKVDKPETVTETIEEPKEEVVIEEDENEGEVTEDESTIDTESEDEAAINIETENKDKAPTEIETEDEVVETESATEDESTPLETINIDDIQNSFDNWNSYNKRNIDLMSTFNPLDNMGAIMDKGMFLTLLRTGGYIAVKSEKEGKIQYQLTNIEGDDQEKIKKSIVSKATIAHQYFKMEGKKLPSYDFVDLKGKSHNKADTKGKIVVLKCWFITCKVCVEEFPQLNSLVDKYKDDNIEFISLAFDEKDKLIEFLKTKPFKYVTIPNQKKYMAKKLKVKQYPTHLIVDANGVIIKMVNNVKTLTSELERILGK
ncbi:TlpA disulfide reductase family protein [Tenacibaculum sp. HL-MS23]|uniref:TlpA family protein disulfide reductase n=1 Tax=Tenacibaculum sp. HL-MS23 TaxID=3077734 RepID=UPI0028FC259A|nr:TlpA disulfide reductase family protein [Tenacibaculum sp. HL-MS23]WNW00730.1 TlpA disulfide reductase family protein [Tenacibaculum sp. HL-MS23]